MDVHECKAMQFLSIAGWPHGELKMVFGVSEHDVRTHLTGGCGHDRVNRNDGTPSDDTLRERMVSYRFKHDLTQEEAAEQLGVSAASWSNWESASRSPSRRNRLQLRQLLDSSHSDRTDS